MAMPPCRTPHAALEKVAEPADISGPPRPGDAGAAGFHSPGAGHPRVETPGASVADRQADQVFGFVEGYTVELGEGWQGQLQDLSRLRWLRDAGAVVLDGPQVTNEWLKYVACMPNCRC